MTPTLERILSLEVPLIVLLGERQLPLGDVIQLVPGAIVELPKNATEELELLVNNKVIGTGVAVKVGENFGLRLSHVGDARDRIGAMSAKPAPTAVAPAEAASASDDDLEAMAAQMLAGQI
ncbi:MAG: FliM/FliN family flagellar motor switch protein [Planctomycetota bacterium]|nr:FliM/FliN family flagellar motor switch protein [Planctomycetota bacterium]